DAFVSAEAPRLRPYLDAMRANLARAMGIGVQQVSVKAGTAEGLGPVGRGEAIEARAVVTVLRHVAPGGLFSPASSRSEEHTSELQSRAKGVCRLLLEKKKTQ